MVETVRYIEIEVDSGEDMIEIPLHQIPDEPANEWEPYQTDTFASQTPDKVTLRIWLRKKRT